MADWAVWTSNQKLGLHHPVVVVKLQQVISSQPKGARRWFKDQMSCPFDLQGLRHLDILCTLWLNKFATVNLLENPPKWRFPVDYHWRLLLWLFTNSTTSYTKRVLWKVLTFSLHLKRLSQGQGVATEGNRGSLFVVANQGPYYGYYLLCIYWAAEPQQGNSLNG